MSTTVSAGVALLGLLFAGCSQLNPPAGAAGQQDQLQVRVDETFRLSDADNWQFRTPGLWKVTGEADRRYLQMSEPPQRPVLPGVRRPQEYAIYKPYEFRSFALSCFVRLDRDARTAARDACIIFGRQDDTHMYYVHLSALSDGAHNTVMRVDGATRQSLVPGNQQIKPVMIDHEWHKVDVLRNADTGLIQVYVDARDAKTARPYFEVADKTYEWGYVGLGSRDDHASFARILIEGQARPPANPPMVDEASAPPGSPN